MRKLIIGILFFVLLVPAANAMTSTNFIIRWDALDSGGSDLSSSTNYSIRDTLGQQGVGSSTSENYILRAGYRQGDTETTIVSFDIGTQEDSTKVSYTAFDFAGKTVTLSSVASFSTGSSIGVVENEGLSENVAVGKITSIAGLVVGVDSWDGNPASIGAIPSGGDDFAYRLNGSAVTFGTMVPTTPRTSITKTNVVSNVSAGYSVFISSDGDLRYTSSTFILPVSDGTVTSGSEEYGAQTFGATATSTGFDFGISTSTREIQTSTTYANADRIAAVYKISVGPNTSAGNFTQLVYFTLVPRF